MCWCIRYATDEFGTVRGLGSVVQQQAPARVAPTSATVGYLRAAAVFCCRSISDSTPKPFCQSEIKDFDGAIGNEMLTGRRTFSGATPSDTLAAVLNQEPDWNALPHVLVNADGTERLIDEERVTFENPQFSPDGRRVAVATRRRMGESTEIWVHDLEKGAPSRLTFDGGRAPVWTPDGAAVTYSHLGERQGIYRKSADGVGAAERLIALDAFHWLIGWTPDGRTLAYGLIEGRSERGTSLSSIRALSDGKSRHIVQPGSVWGGRLSPDGRWLAYYLLESGTYEVYLTPFPEGGARWLISENGGRDPSWGGRMERSCTTEVAIVWSLRESTRRAASVCYRVA